MIFTKAQAIEKMIDFSVSGTSISTEQADAILTALGKDPRAFYKADAQSVQLKRDVLDVEKTKSILVDGGFATDAEVETAKASIKAR